MEKELLKNAVEDISLIKSVINRTKNSFSGFSKIFILWGILFSGLSFLQWVQNMNIEATLNFYTTHQYLSYLTPLLMIAIAATIYKVVANKQPLEGLERHIMLLWIFIILMLMIPTQVRIIDPDNLMTDQITISTNNLSLSIFALGIALIMTSVLTELQIFKPIGITYLAIAFVHSYFYFSFIETIAPILGYLILPFTMIFTGVYLKWYHERSRKDGTEFNS